jgi:hypothetical protein
MVVSRLQQMCISDGESCLSETRFQGLTVRSLRAMARVQVSRSLEKPKSESLEVSKVCDIDFVNNYDWESDFRLWQEEKSQESKRQMEGPDSVGAKDFIIGTGVSINIHGPVTFNL